MEPSPLSEGSTANLGQSSVAEQAEAIRVVGALSEAQIRGLHRDRLADIFFLMFLHGLDPFAGQRPLNGRVLSAYAASPLSDEAPSVSRMLSQFQNLNAAVQSSAANYRQAYPGASEEFLRHALWQSWRAAWQGIAAGAQGYATNVTSSQLHETVQSVQEAQQIRLEYPRLGPNELAGVGDPWSVGEDQCIRRGVCNWGSEELMRRYAVRSPIADYRAWNWPFTQYYMGVPWVNFAENPGGPTLVTENFLNSQRVLVGPAGYRDPSGRVLAIWPPITNEVARAQVAGLNQLIVEQRRLRGRPC
jgi:hypothetical protein